MNKWIISASSVVYPVDSLISKESGIVPVVLRQAGRSKAGSVSRQKLMMEVMMQVMEMTANTRAASELAGSSHNNHRLRCQATYIHIIKPIYLASYPQRDRK